MRLRIDVNPNAMYGKCLPSLGLGIIHVYHLVVFIEVKYLVPFLAPDINVFCYHSHVTSYIRDATFRKMTNQNQTDTNEMTTTETKYQTDFYSAEKYQY